MQGGSFTGDIDDVKYLRDKLFSALKIPASYLSRADGSDEDKTTLAQKDIRFARTIQRLQRSVVSELEKIGIIHLYTLGFREDDLINFKLSLNNPSKIAELQELEHWDKKFSVATSATDGFFSRRWVAEHLFNMSDEEFLRNQRELFYDKKFDARLGAMADAAAEEATGGLGGLGDLGDLGDDDLGGEDLGDLGDLGGEDLGGEDAGEEDILLSSPGEEAPPGRREDGYYTPNSKGKPYFPVKHDKRKTAGRGKNYARKASPEVSKRTIYPGYSSITGLKSLESLSTGLKSLANGVFEEKESNYVKRELLEESKILSNNSEIIMLLESLERKKDEI